MGKRLTTAERKRLGTFRADRTRPVGAVVALDKLPPPPRGMRPEVAKERANIGGRMAEAGTLAPDVLPTVDLVAEAVVRARTLSADPTVKPSMVTNAMRLAMDGLKTLGLTPRTRTYELRPRAPEVAEYDPAAEFGRNQ